MLLVIALVLALLIKTFLVKAFYIPSGSMEKTLHGCPGCSGDRVLVNKVVYRLRDPRRGDIVVFKGPESCRRRRSRSTRRRNPVREALRAVGQPFGVAAPGEKDFVKRVIAVGGQTVAVLRRAGPGHRRRRARSTSRTSTRPTRSPTSSRSTGDRAARATCG